MTDAEATQETRVDVMTAETTDLTTGQTSAAEPFFSGSGINLSGLGKTFTMGRNTVTALEDANLSTEKGSFLSLLGPSGCGKSTILRILAGLERPTSGTAWSTARPPRSCAGHELGIAFQDSALLPVAQRRCEHQAAAGGRRPAGRRGPHQRADRAGRA